VRGEKFARKEEGSRRPDFTILAVLVRGGRGAKKGRKAGHTYAFLHAGGGAGGGKDVPSYFTNATSLSRLSNK